LCHLTLLPPHAECRTPLPTRRSIYFLAPSLLLQNLLRYVSDELRNKGKPAGEWTAAVVSGVPRQLNSYDCGVFTCMFARYAAEGMQMNFTQVPIVRLLPIACVAGLISDLNDEG
jgi:hypothetical protein